MHNPSLVRGADGIDNLERHRLELLAVASWRLDVDEVLQRTAADVFHDHVSAFCNPAKACLIPHDIGVIHRAQGGNFALEAFAVVGFRDEVP